MVLEYMDFVSKMDPEVGAAIRAEYQRQCDNIELIASENIVSETVLAAAGSVLTNKYAEGYSGKRYYGGCQCVDVVEDIACDLQGEPIEIAFNAKYISDVIRNITDDSMCMRFNSNVSPCVVCPPEGDDYLYLILPVRIFQ